MRSNLNDAVDRFIELFVQIRWTHLTALIMLGLGMLIETAPQTGVVPFMTERGFPPQPYALFLVFCGAVLFSRPNIRYSVALSLPLIVYCFFTLWYFNTLPDNARNYIPAFLYTSLYVFVLWHGIRDVIAGYEKSAAEQEKDAEDAE
jgi:hypothetical protein